MRKKIVAGNWKMNKTPKEAAEFCKLMKEKVVSDAIEVVFCVPFVDLYPVLEELKGTGIGVGAENMHFAESGAYTGEVSAQMLKEMGVGYVILGHSERRQSEGEKSSGNRYCADSLLRRNLGAERSRHYD